MNQHALTTPLTAAQPPRDDSGPPPAPAPIRRLWHAWLWLTGPRPDRFGRDVVALERLRRSRLISFLLILVAITILLLIPAVFSNPGFWQVTLLFGALGGLATLFNRAGLVTLSGLTLIAVNNVAVIDNILRQPHGLTNTSLGNLYLLVIAIMIAGMVLPNRLILLVGAVQVAICVLVFTLLPPQFLLTQEIILNGNQGYNAILGPILLMVGGTGMVWLYAWSVDRAILRASRAEDLAAARARLNEQARLIAEQKQHLEVGIQALQEVQARVANGDYGARATLQGNELLPLAVSFNLMAERLSRVQQVEGAYNRTESALKHALEMCNAPGEDADLLTIPSSGTQVDRLIPFLVRLRQQTHALVQGSTFAEDLRAMLNRQQERLALTEQQLTSGLMLAKDLQAQALAAPLSNEGASILNSSRLGTRGAEPAAAIPSPLQAALAQHIALLERARKESTHAYELGRHCLQGIRVLSQRLKEAA